MSVNSRCFLLAYGPIGIVIRVLSMLEEAFTSKDYSAYYIAQGHCVYERTRYTQDLYT